MEYAEVFSKLSYETAILTFIKKDGSIRFMLGTRNLKTVSLQWGFQGQKLGGHDKRCNIQNGNVAVFDMIIGESRSFGIDRLMNIEYLGEIETVEQLNKAVEDFVKYRDKCEETLKSGDVFNNIE